MGLYRKFFPPSSRNKYITESPSHRVTMSQCQRINESMNQRNKRTKRTKQTNQRTNDCTQQIRESPNTCPETRARARPRRSRQVDAIVAAVAAGLAAPDRSRAAAALDAAAKALPPTEARAASILHF